MPTAPDGSPDFDAIWERNKERIQERQPGITKEAWIKMAKEGSAQGGRRSPEGGQSGQSVQSAPEGSGGRRNAQMTPEQIANAATSSGLFKSGGPFYQGEYVLRPGMTANVTITTNQKNGILRVPNNALRFDPSAYIKDAVPTPQAGFGQQGTQRPAGGAAQGGNQERRSRLMDRGIVTKREDKIWILDENRKPKALVVKAGLTDGQYTEVSGEGVSEGLELLVGVDEVKKSAQAASPLQVGGVGGGGRR
jgi:HlyD family secretion protein